MNTLDIITIAVIVVTAILGLGLGFGRGIRALSRGWFGKIISLAVCYLFFGLVLKIPFVSDLLDKFVAWLDGGNWFLRLLKTIRIDLIVFALVLYLIVRMLLKLVASIVGSVFELDNPVVKIVNKILGVAIYLFMLLLLVLVVFQVAYYIGGANGVVYQKIEGSMFGLDKLYLNNPLNNVIDSIKNASVA